MRGELLRRDRALQIIRNFNWEVGIVKPSLKFLGLWPDGPYQTCYFILNIAMQGYILSVYLPSIVIADSISDKIDKLFAFIALIMCMVDLSVYRAQWSKIRLLLVHVRRNWMGFIDLPVDIRAIMVSYGAETRHIVTLLYLIIGVAVTLFCLEPILLHLAYPSKIALELPNDAWVPYDTTALTVYITIYIIQCLCSISAALIFASIDCCIIWMIFHCCGQLEIVATLINQYEGIHHHANPISIADGQPIHGCNCLHCIVQYHLRIFKIITLFDDAFHIIMAARMIICTFSFICVGYTIIKLQEDGSIGGLMVRVVFLLTMNFSLFIYCWLGDRLKENSMKIATNAFHQQVFGKGVIGKEVMMIIRQAMMRPCCITAAKFFVLSLELFKEYFLKSISYLSVLVALRANDRS